MDEYEIEVSGKTLEDAVLEAAIRLGVAREKVSYEVISKGSSGFLGIGGKKAVIKARIKTEEEIEAGKKADEEMEKIHNKVYAAAVKEEDKTEDVEEKVKEKTEIPQNRPQAKEKNKKKTYNEKKKPAERKEPAEVTESKVTPVINAEAETKEEEKPPVEPEENIPAEPVDTAKVERFLIDVFSAMDMEVGVNITQNPKEREVDIDLSGEDMAVLIGKRGQTLDSLQYLASLVINRDSDVYIRVKVDIENYRERRKATLENLARNMAQKARRTGKAVSLEPMNPYERRVIHSALQNDRYVTTHSEGEEPYRHVVINLKEGVKPAGNNNRNRGRNKRQRGGGYYNGSRKGSRGGKEKSREKVSDE